MLPTLKQTQQRNETDKLTQAWAARYPSELYAINEYRRALELPPLYLVRKVAE